MNHPMNRRSLASIVLFAALVAAVPASRLVAQDAPSAATGTFKVDPAHSAAVYRITHLNTSAHWGFFKEPTGTFAIADDGALSVDVAIDVSKLDSGNAKRDQHLQGPDFFNAKQFPQMTFKSTGSTKSGEGAYLVKGDLTIKGVGKPVEVTFKKVGEGKGMKGDTIAGYEAEFTVNRLDYGVSYMPDALGNDVKVIVALEGSKQ